MELWELRERQKLPLEIKEKITKDRIKSWHKFWKGNIFVSFSGGKDSTVLLHQVRKIYPNTPAVFIDTGVEYPEIRNFIKTFNNIIWLKPKVPFHKVIKKHGYPIISKMQARYISDIQNANKKNKATVRLRLTGLTKENKYAPSMKLSKKWLPLVYSKFKISAKCCDIIKKSPIYNYQKITRRNPIIGTMACESNIREKTYLKIGCNHKNGNKPVSMPIAFWIEQDIWNYIKKYNIPYSKIYDMGEKNTGCMFCMFGVHLEKGENRFQRMYKNHPKHYDYCINKLGYGEILDFIGVSYKPKPSLGILEKINKKILNGEN